MQLFFFAFDHKYTYRSNGTMEGILLQKVPRGLLFIHFDFEPHIQNKNLEKGKGKKSKLWPK